MDNIKIIDYTLFVIGEVKTLVELWKTKPFVEAEEQKKVAGMLVQLLSNIWMIEGVAGVRGAESSAATDKTDELKKNLQDILASVDKLHEKLNARPYVSEPALQPDDDQTFELEEGLPGQAQPQEAPALPTASEQPEEAQEFSDEKYALKQPAKPERAPHPKQTAPYPSLFNKFSTHDKDEPALLTPVNNLAAAIGLNDKFMFIRELFNNSEKAFSKALVRIDNMSGLEEAQEYFTTTVLNDENRNTYAAKQFGNLLIRRYMSR
ncbi:MAG: hypothetical protein LBF90_00110 [Prevotellaceae bacterium]|jgi:hypothetical protein|nr:hypothetical protein [Prevotellaceae bacterium]